MVTDGSGGGAVGFSTAETWQVMTDDDDADPSTAPTPIVSPLGNPYLFTARRLDPELKTYYYRNRYYDADRGRFISRDPLGYVDGMGLYVYGKGGSSLYLDPFGTSIIEVDNISFPPGTEVYEGTSRNDIPFTVSMGILVYNRKSENNYAEFSVDVIPYTLSGNRSDGQPEIYTGGNSDGYLDDVMNGKIRISGIGLCEKEGSPSIKVDVSLEQGDGWNSTWEDGYEYTKGTYPSLYRHIVGGSNYFFINDIAPVIDGKKRVRLPWTKDVSVKQAKCSGTRGVPSENKGGSNTGSFLLRGTLGQMPSFKGRFEHNQFGYWGSWEVQWSYDCCGPIEERGKLKSTVSLSSKGLGIGTTPKAKPEEVLF